jgi:hypothetical protein
MLDSQGEPQTAGGTMVLLIRFKCAYSNTMLIFHKHYPLQYYPHMHQEVSLSWVWGCVPIVPATQGAEAGGSLEP